MNFARDSVRADASSWALSALEVMKKASLAAESAYIDCQRNGASKAVACGVWEGSVAKCRPNRPFGREFGIPTGAE